MRDRRARLSDQNRASDFQMMRPHVTAIRLM
jgi:hypothetical protein